MNPVDLMTKPLAKPKIEQLMGIMGYEFIGDDVDSKKQERDDVLATWIQEVWRHGGELCIEGQQQWR